MYRRLIFYRLHGMRVRVVNLFQVVDCSNHLKQLLVEIEAGEPFGYVFVDALELVLSYGIVDF